VSEFVCLKVRCESSAELPCEKVASVCVCVLCVCVCVCVYTCHRLLVWYWTIFSTTSLCLK
jgi:hypothetical protein